MTDRDELADLRAEIPIALKEKLRQGDATIREQVVEAIEIYTGEAQADSRAAIERQIERYKEQRARGEQLMQDGEQMKEEADAAIGRLEQKLATIEETATSYEEALDDLLEEMHDNETSVQADHAKVESIAKSHSKPSEAVLEDLRQRSELHESYFTTGAPEPPEDDHGVAWERPGDAA